MQSSFNYCFINVGFKRQYWNNSWGDLMMEGGFLWNDNLRRTIIISLTVICWGCTGLHINYYNTTLIFFYLHLTMLLYDKKIVLAVKQGVLWFSDIYTAIISNIDVKHGQNSQNSLYNKSPGFNLLWTFSSTLWRATHAYKRLSFP